MTKPGTWLIGKTWAPEIVLMLAERPQRFNRMLEKISGISDRMLSVRLRDLEYFGLVVRLVEPGPPISVTYALTDAGERYVPALSQLHEVARAV